MTRLAALALALSITAASAQVLDPPPAVKLLPGEDAPRGEFVYRGGETTGAWTLAPAPNPREVDGDGSFGATSAYGGLMVHDCPDVPLPVDRCTFVEINRHYAETGTHILIEIRKGPDVLVIVYGDGRVIGDPRLFPEASRLFFEAMGRAYPAEIKGARHRP